MSVSLRQLRYFLALADQGQFTRAAEVAHISQPALSMQIKALEDQLGQQLVERTSAGILLTPEGRRVAAHARNALREVAALEQATRLPGGGRLLLGMIPTVAPYLLPTVLPVLRSADISRDLHLREAQTERLLDELADGLIDAAVIATPVDDAALTGQALFTDRFLLAGSTARIQAARGEVETLRPRALDPNQLLLLDEGHCLGDQALEVCGLNRRMSRLDLGAASLATLCRLAGQGMGLTFLPEIAMPQELAAAPGLCAVRFDAPEPSREVLLVRRASTPASGWFSELAQMLAEAGQGLTTAAGAAVRDQVRQS